MTSEPLRLRRWVLATYVGLMGVFVANRFVLRPWVVERGGPEGALVVVFSVPNFVEAVMGTLVLTALGLLARARYPDRLGRVSEETVQVGATALAGIYVLTQEFGIHDLGGANVVDPWDAVASVLGLVVALICMRRWGVLRGGGAGGTEG